MANKNSEIPNLVKIQNISDTVYFMYFHRECKLAGTFQRLTWQHVEKVKMLIFYEIAIHLSDIYPMEAFATPCKCVQEIL